jgi:hypothetical protein
MPETYKIYGLKLINGDQIRYIGYTKNSIEYRLSEHKKQSKNGKYRNAFWVKKYRNEIEAVLIEDEIPTKQDACEKEKMYIKLFKSFGAILTNGTKGGEGGNYWSGKKLSDDAKRKMSESKKGKKLSDSHRENVIRSLIGRKHNEETKRKMSESAKKRWNKND